MADHTASALAAETKHEADPPVDNNAVKPEAKSAVSVSETAPKKTPCKKHPAKESDRNRDPKKKYKSHKASSIITPSDDSSPASSSNEDDLDSATEDDDEEEEESPSEESESEPDRKHRRGRRVKNRTRRALKGGRKKKTRSHYQDESESDEEDSQDPSLLDEKELKKLVSKLKGRMAKKILRDDEISEDPLVEEDEIDVDDAMLSLAKEKLAALRLKQGGKRRVKHRGKRASDGLNDGQKGGSHQSKGRKKAAASKIAFKRVDQRTYPSCGFPEFACFCH